MIVLLALGWIVFLGQPTALSGQLRALFTRLGTPLVKLGDAIPTVASRRALARTNAVLVAENQSLRQRSLHLEETAREHQRLQELIKLKSRLPYQTIAARVIARDSSNWWRSIQIDRGTADQVDHGLPVVTDRGLVGRVIEAGKNESRVLLLLDPSCRASAVLAQSRETGVVSGVARAFSRRPVLEMTFVDRAAQIAPGELVLTSSLSRQFPKGLAVGTVLSAELDAESGMYQRLELVPTVDFRRLEEVLVILRTVDQPG